MASVRDANGKARGTIAADSYFCVSRTRSRHYLRMHQGYCFNEFVWLQVRRQCVGIRIKEQDTGRVLECTIAVAMANMTEPFRLYGNNAGDEQVCLPERCMDVVSGLSVPPPLF